jgi:hypothetical protein
MLLALAVALLLIAHGAGRRAGHSSSRGTI